MKEIPKPILMCIPEPMEEKDEWSKGFNTCVRITKHCLSLLEETPPIMKTNSMHDYIINNILPKERGGIEQEQASHCGLYHWNDCLHECQAKVPETIEYIKGEMREKVKELTYYHNDEGVKEIENGVNYVRLDDVLSLLETNQEK